MKRKSNFFVKGFRKVVDTLNKQYDKLVQIPPGHIAVIIPESQFLYLLEGLADAEHWTGIPYSDILIDSTIEENKFENKPQLITNHE